MKIFLRHYIAFAITAYC